jgi:hypothetical protein
LIVRSGVDRQRYRTAFEQAHEVAIASILSTYERCQYK